MLPLVLCGPRTLNSLIKSSIASSVEKCLPMAYNQKPWLPALETVWGGDYLLLSSYSTNLIFAFVPPLQMTSHWHTLHTVATPQRGDYLPQASPTLTTCASHTQLRDIGLCDPHRNQHQKEGIGHTGPPQLSPSTLSHPHFDCSPSQSQLLFQWLMKMTADTTNSHRWSQTRAQIHTHLRCVLIFKPAYHTTAAIHSVRQLFKQHCCHSTANHISIQSVVKWTSSLLNK